MKPTETEIEKLQNDVLKICLERDINIKYINDGHHSFNELYYYRMLYNAAIFNEWSKQSLFDIHKSKRHNDGEKCFGGGWFIVVANLPTGQITNHYRSKYWKLFQIPEKEIPLFEYDGHTSEEASKRLLNFIKTNYQK